MTASEDRAFPATWFRG